MPTATRRRGRGQATGETLPAVIETVQGEIVDQSPAAETEARVKEALREGKSALWKLAEACYQFDQQSGWRALGYDSLTGWLADPEIDMTRGTYYRLVKTWQQLAVDQGLEPAQLEAVSMSKAAIVVEDIASGDVQVDAALKDAANLTASQLREKYEKPRRGRPPKAEPVEHHSPSTALKAAAELPWDLLDQAVRGRSTDLKLARLKEAIPLFLAWRAEFLG